MTKLFEIHTCQACRDTKKYDNDKMYSKYLIFSDNSAPQLVVIFKEFSCSYSILEDRNTNPVKDLLQGSAVGLNV